MIFNFTFWRVMITQKYNFMLSFIYSNTVMLRQKNEMDVWPLSLKDTKRESSAELVVPFKDRGSLICNLKFLCKSRPKLIVNFESSYPFCGYFFSPHFGQQCLCIPVANRLTHNFWQKSKFKPIVNAEKKKLSNYLFQRSGIPLKDQKEINWWLRGLSVYYNC